MFISPRISVIVLFSFKALSIFETLSLLSCSSLANVCIFIFIIFVCLFDAIGKGKPLYTFENICLEDRQTPLQDGTKKVIINAEAFGKAKDAELKGFLEYLKTGAINTEYTGRIETMIQAVKHNEQARREYRFMSGFEMDAREEGRSEGFADGSYQTKLETARLMKEENCEISFIQKMTGLSKEEVENI